MSACPATDDFFRTRLNHMIDPRQPLAVLASHMPWQESGHVGAAPAFGEQGVKILLNEQY